MCKWIKFHHWLKILVWTLYRFHSKRHNIQFLKWTTHFLWAPGPLPPPWAQKLQFCGSPWCSTQRFGSCGCTSGGCCVESGKNKTNKQKTEKKRVVLNVNWKCLHCQPIQHTTWWFVCESTKTTYVQVDAAQYCQKQIKNRWSGE